MDEVATAALAPAVALPARVVPARMAAATGGLALFVMSLMLMKAGASSLAPMLDGSFFTDSVPSALGLGWLGACALLSGSPVAASSLALLDGGVLNRAQSFAMLAGSRLGASFVVLAVGFLYALRRPAGTGRRTPLTIGVISFFLTAVIYVPGALLGGLLLDRGALDGLELSSAPRLVAVTEAAFGWGPHVVTALLPTSMAFPVGLAVLVLGFKVFDRALPALAGSELEARSGGWHKKPWLMFLVGFGITLLTLSVSLSLTLLVPLVARHHLDREDALPYIAGASISTLADTLVAAILLGNADAVRVVLAALIGVSAWTLVVIGPLYVVMRVGILGLTAKVLATPHRFALFLGALVGVPLVLVAV